MNRVRVKKIADIYNEIKLMVIPDNCGQAKHYKEMVLHYTSLLFDELKDRRIKTIEVKDEK